MIEQGYNATSLDQVIAESSSSKGAFFHHFGSKADLALQLTQRTSRQTSLTSTPASKPRAGIADPSRRLVEFLRFSRTTLMH